MHGTSTGARPVTFLSEDSVHVRGTYYETRGDRALSVLLVHDALGDRTVWDPYVPLFRSRGWNILTFDLRGHGESVRQDMRHALLQPDTSDFNSPHAYPNDLRAAAGFAQRQPKHEIGRLAVIGLGFGADLAFAGAGRGWGGATSVCVSLDEPRARLVGGHGAFTPRSCYLIYGSADPAFAASAEAFKAVAVSPAEAHAYPTTAQGPALWEERQPEIIARAIGWVEKTV